MDKDSVTRDKLYRKAASQFYDPCEAESKRSMRCLEENEYKKSSCTDLFQEYRDCKKKWGRIRLEERLKSGGFLSNQKEVETKPDQ